MNRTIDNSQDILDVRDIIARFEELEAMIPVGRPALDRFDASEEGAEYRKLLLLLDELKGNGGDEQWRGDWYPITLVRDSYFKDYAYELLEECGDIPKSLPHYVVIDLEATAKNLLVDYSSVEFDGVTYWFR